MTHRMKNPERPRPGRRRGRVALLGLFALALAPGPAAAACTVGGSAYSDGAAACLPQVLGGEVRKVLHGCEGSAWVSREVACPERYAYFCAVGPHAVEVGERLRLGSGPQAIECRFPGVLALVGAGGGAAPFAEAPPSRTIRRVQAFLAADGAGSAFGLTCEGPDCSGRADAATMAALAAHLAANARNLTPDERARFGLDGAANAEAAVAARSPVDLFPLFVETFDVPDID